MLLIRGGGPSSGYVSTGFFGGKLLVSHCLLVLEHIFRSYFGPCRLSGCDQEGNSINISLSYSTIPDGPNEQFTDWSF